MEFRAGADLEVLAEEYAVRRTGAALAPVDGIARVGVDEGALRETTLARSVQVSCSAAGGGGKMKGNKKKPSATPKAVPSTAPAMKMATEQSMMPSGSRLPFVPCIRTASRRTHYIDALDR